MLCASFVVQSISERLLYVNASVSQVSVCNNFLRPMFFCAKDFSLTVRAFLRAEQLRWVETNSKEMRKVDQCSDEMKTVEKNLLNWHVRRDGMRWEELRWGEKSSHDLRDEVSSAKCKCEVWRVQCEVWRKCLLGVALRRGREQVMFLDNICATASHKATNKSVKCVVWSVKSAVRSAKWSFKCDMWNRTQLSQSARTHGLGWRTAHASSIDEKGLIYP